VDADAEAEAVKQRHRREHAVAGADHRVRRDDVARLDLGVLVDLGREAVELDEDMVEQIKKIEADNLEIVHKDILKTDISEYITGQAQPKLNQQNLNNIITYLKQFKDKNIHLVITTHSPFLLSDVPKENVIFLVKYDKTIFHKKSIRK
jgi:hypothetical protein